MKIKYSTAEKLLKLNGYNIERIHPDVIDENLCLIAVSQNGYCLDAVPKKFRTRSVCLAALAAPKDSYGVGRSSVIADIPSRHINESFMEEAMKLGWKDLSDICINNNRTSGTVLLK